jgi:hypothetical protein
VSQCGKQEGYHTGSAFKAAHDNGVEVMVSIPLVAAHASDINYDMANFVYVRTWFKKFLLFSALLSGKFYK